MPHLPRRLRYRSIASEEETDVTDEAETNHRNHRNETNPREEHVDDDNNNDRIDEDKEEEVEKPRNRITRTTTNANATNPVPQTTPLLSSSSSLIEVIILDFCQTRFTVTTSPNTTIAEFKKQGYAVHQVPPNQQRLIYQGRMLNDSTSAETVGSGGGGGETTTTTTNAPPRRLCDYGIKSNGCIVHLFPKPRVVVVPDAASSPPTATTTTTVEDEEMANSTNTTTTARSARIPTIVLSNEEAEQRGQILVLGNLDYIEAVNNVKLFSFMLLIVSTIELLNLLSILMGTNTTTDDNYYGRTDDSTLNYNTNNNTSDHFHNHHPYIQPEDDDLFHDDILIPPPDGLHPSNYSSYNSTATGNPLYPEDPAAAIYETWSTLSWLDLIVSSFGVYVAVLGLRASNDNRLSMARLYLLGLIITAIGWLGYNYMITVQVDEAVAESIHTTTGNEDDDENNEEDVYGQAFQVMVLPAMIWCLCIFRAWQFQYLLSEAELEAAERIAQHDAEHSFATTANEAITITDAYPNHPPSNESQSHTHRTIQNPSTTWIGNGVLS